LEILSLILQHSWLAVWFCFKWDIGDTYAVFEPTHGSAPKYAGMYKVNPMAMLLTVTLMLDWLDEKKPAKKLENA